MAHRSSGSSRCRRRLLFHCCCESPLPSADRHRRRVQPKIRDEHPVAGPFRAPHRARHRQRLLTRSRPVLDFAQSERRNRARFCLATAAPAPRDKMIPPAHARVLLKIRSISLSPLPKNGFYSDVDALGSRASDRLRSSVGGTSRDPFDEMTRPSYDPKSPPFSAGI